VDRAKLSLHPGEGLQLLQPLFEFSGACAGCGETAYIQAADSGSSATGVHRQRHRLFVNLRRQPAYHAIRQQCCRRGPTSANSLLEDKPSLALGMEDPLSISRRSLPELLTTRLARPLARSW